MVKYLNKYLYLNGRKNYLLYFLKLLCLFFSIMLLAFYIVLLKANGGFPDISTLNDIALLSAIATIGMLLGSIISIFTEFWGALTMFAFYAMNTFVNGIEFNLYFDSFLFLSIFNFLIYYLRFK